MGDPAMTGGYWLLWTAHRAFVPLALLVLAGCAPDYPGCAPARLNVREMDVVDDDQRAFHIHRKFELVGSDPRLIVHNLRLARVYPELEGTNDDERGTERESTDYRVAVSNGIAAAVIWVGMIAAGCWLCALGDGDCSLKRKIGLQGLGLVFILAAAPVAIVGSYRITHDDWGLLSALLLPSLTSMCAPDGQLLAEWPDGITRRVVDANGVRVDCIFPVEVPR